MMGLEAIKVRQARTLNKTAAEAPTPTNHATRKSKIHLRVNTTRLPPLTLILFYVSWNIWPAIPLFLHPYLVPEPSQTAAPMAAKLDAQKLAFVFEGRPDLVAGIQQAAGRKLHQLTGPRLTCPDRLPRTNHSVQQHCEPHLRPPVGHRRRGWSVVQEEARRHCDADTNKRIAEWPDSRPRGRRPGPRAPRNQGDLRVGAPAQKVQPVLHQELSVCPRGRDRHAGAGDHLPLERDWYAPLRGP